MWGAGSGPGAVRNATAAVQPSVVHFPMVDDPAFSRHVYLIPELNSVVSDPSQPARGGMARIHRQTSTRDRARPCRSYRAAPVQPAMAQIRWHGTEKCPGVDCSVAAPEASGETTALIRPTEPNILRDTCDT
jgi:hypothetical protein